MGKKRCVALLLTMIMVMTAALGSTIPQALAGNDTQELPSYNAYEEYSTTANPSGVWSYQHLKNGVYTNLTYDATNSRWGTTDPGRLHTVASGDAKGDQVTGRDTIAVRPESTTTDTVLTFTAPYSGKINVSMANGGVFAPHNSVDEISFTFKQNDTVVRSVSDLDASYNHPSSSRFFADTVELTVTEGDELHFIVHRNKQSANPQTYFNPFIEYTELEEEELPSYNAYEEYSTEANPNGVWSYQHLKNGVYTNLTYDATNSRWGTIDPGRLHTVTSDLVTGKAAIAVRPESTTTDTVLTFTAPYSGKINVSMANGGVFAPHNSVDEISFTFKQNDTVVRSVSDLDNAYNASGSRFFADTVELTVTEGDELHFIVHRNKQSANPQTYFNPQIAYETRDDETQKKIMALNPVNHSEVTIVSDSVKEWMDTYDITETKFSEYLGKGDIYYSGQVTLKWSTPRKADSYVVTYATNEELSDAKSVTTTQNLVKINNLYAGTGYYWQVKAVYSEGEPEISDVFTFSTAKTRRTVYIDGVSNTRDLGGIVNSNGQEIKQGLIYRGAQLNDITEAGIEQAVSELGIRTDLDLRQAGESGAGTASPIGNGVKYINQNAPQYALIAQYKTNVKNIIKVFADEDNYPIYYHCQVGRDRTGTIGALLLGLLGVDKEQIYMDYELSAFSYAGGTLGSPTAEGLRSGMDSLYNYLESYGDGDFSKNVEAFLLDCGITKEEIVSIRKILLGDGGEPPVVKPTYNAYEEYSATANPNGVWSYQYLNNGTYTDMTYDAENSRWGTTDPGRLHTVTSDLVSGKAAIAVRPESTTTDTVLTFTAPYSGIISISMANGGVFAPHQGNDEISFILKQNGTTIKSVSDLDNAYNASGSRFFADAVTRRVEAGDKLHFIVHRNKKSADPLTYFNPQIVYKEVGDDALGFPSDGEIKISKIKTDGFTMEWPSAVGGTGTYAYTVYCSETPFAGTPTEGGVTVTGNTYTFTGLTFRKSYYVAVVVDDGEYQIALQAPEAVEVFSDMFTFNAYEDFAAGAQNGAWSYLSAPIGTMQTSPLVWDGTQWGNSVLGSVKAAKSDLVTGRSALCVKPGTDTDTIVAFMAPYSGTVKVSLANGGIFVPLNGSGDRYDGINFTMLLNEVQKARFEQVCAKQNHPSSVDPSRYTGRVFTDAYELQVTKGDILYFVVNRNTALHNDDTYFNPSVEYLSVDEGTLNLRFCEKRMITTTDVTRSTMTVNWPRAFGGTGEYRYTLYLSNSPIKSIPTGGGIDMGNATSYVMTNLPPYTDYYFAVQVNDGENIVSLISPEAHSTIGNTYVFDAVKEYTEEMQPISTPWRYYWQDTKTGELSELPWNEETKQYGDTTTPKLKAVTSDMVTGKAALQAVPQMGKDAVIAFIAPYGGTITIDMANNGIFAPYNGKPQEYDGINFILKQNGETLYRREAVSSQYSHKDRCFATGMSVQVSAGDILYFTINSNKTTSEDRTFLAPRVSYTYVNKGSDAFGFLPGATIKATEIGKDSFRLNWSSVFDPEQEAVTYKVWISTSPLKKQPSSNPVYTGRELSAFCKGLKFATKYYAYIVATNASGKEAVLSTNTAVMTECPVYDAYKQYSAEKNEAGVWNYAVRTLDTGTGEYKYTLLKFSDISNGWGTSEGGMIKTTDADPVTGHYAMSVHPGAKNQDAALVFTAPYSGTIRISMNNGGVFAPHNGADQNYDGINFIVNHGTKELWKLESVSGKNLLPEDRVGTGTLEVTVQQGDKIYFVVSANKNNAADSTYFNPYIEYLEVTGGTGTIDTLEGFIIPEPDKVYPASYRRNTAIGTDGLAVPAGETVELASPWPWFLLCGGLLLAICGVNVICFIVIKKKKTTMEEN